MNEVEFNPQFISRMIPKLEWSALIQAADGVSVPLVCWVVLFGKRIGLSGQPNAG